MPIDVIDELMKRDLLDKPISAAFQIAARTSDSYSYDRYGANEWRGAIEALLALGWSETEVEAAMRSKWTRWAADSGGADYGEATAAMVIAFVSDPRNKATRTEAARLAGGCK